MEEYSVPTGRCEIYNFNATRIRCLRHLIAFFILWPKATRIRCLRHLSVLLIIWIPSYQH